MKKAALVRAAFFSAQNDSTYSMKQKFINLPDLPQPNDFTCGASCVASLCKFFGVGTHDIEKIAKELGTNRNQSTDPLKIVNYLNNLGYKVESKQNMTIEDLYNLTDAGVPVIVCVKDYMDVGKHKAEEYGHYVVAIGVTAEYVVCQDPSETNITYQEETIQAPGKILITHETFMKNWHDKLYGNVYKHFGISVQKG